MNMLCLFFIPVVYVQFNIYCLHWRERILVTILKIYLQSQFVLYAIIF